MHFCEWFFVVIKPNQKNLITVSHFSIKQNLSSLQCKAVRFLSDIQQSCLPRPSKSTKTCNYRSWERTGQIRTDCTVDICAVLFLFRFQDFFCTWLQRHIWRNDGCHFRFFPESSALCLKFYFLLFLLTQVCFISLKTT